jgi:hypothetical protein
VTLFYEQQLTLCSVAAPPHNLPFQYDINYNKICNITTSFSVSFVAGKNRLTTLQQTGVSVMHLKYTDAVQFSLL